MFLHYLLQQDGDTLLFKVLNSQIEESVMVDWIEQIYTDIEEVGIIWSLDEIQRISEENVKAHLHQCIRKSSLQWLNNQKNLKPRELFMASFNFINTYSQTS
jgi:hypothetical protein